MKFTLRQLGYFIAAGEAGSIRKASERINVSQPSISTAISQLENDFELQLFVRHHAQGLSLTTAGQAFLRAAREFLLHGKELEQMAGDLGTSIAGKFNVACLTSVAPFVIPELCHSFLLSNTAVKLETQELNQAEILAKIDAGKCDVALTYDLDLKNTVEFIPLLSLPPYALLAEDHSLATRNSVSLTELAAEPLVLLDMPYSRDYFISLFRLSGVTPNIHLRTTQSEVMRGLVARGHGYSLANIRPGNTQALSGGSLVYVEIEDQCPALQLGLVLFAAERRRRLIEAFIEHCQVITANGELPGTLSTSENISAK